MRASIPLALRQTRAVARAPVGRETASGLMQQSGFDPAKRPG